MASLPPPIADTSELEKICAQLASQEFIAVDTEFLRENTYYPKLCLIQLSAGDITVSVDPLANGIDLSALFALMKDRQIMKVFHAGRQDMEIFLTLMQELPGPIFDTQVAAMVCGYGEQVGYDRLVKGVLDINLDKGPRFTDWSQRPLSEKQQRYALDDVIHLASIYPIIRGKIEEAGRMEWLKEESQILTSRSTYEINPADAWMRVKQRGHKPASLNRLKYLAAWRETEARRRDLPKTRLIKDETLVAVAEANPKNRSAFDSIRGFPGGAGSKLVDPVLKTLEQATQVPKEDWPVVRRERRNPPPQATADLLRVLLKHCAEKAGVASKLIANSDDLDRIALGDHDEVKALNGWRNDIFGKDAMDLIDGKIALSTKGRNVKLHRI